MFRVIVCVIVVLAASASAGYDFKDSDFNELLFDELQGIFDDDFDEAQRFRRDTVPVSGGGRDCHRDKGRRDRDFHCCSGEKPDVKQFEVLKEAKKQCIAEIRGDNADDLSLDPFDCEKMQAMKEQMVCTTECMAKKFNLLNKDGTLNRDALLTHLRAKIGDSKWKSNAVEGIVDKCTAELKATKEKEQQEQKEGTTEEAKKGCNQCPLQLTHCIWREFVQGCPAELQIDSGKCKNIRERLSKGDTSYLNKSFVHHFYSHREDKKDREH